MNGLWHFGIIIGSFSSDGTRLSTGESSRRNQVIAEANRLNLYYSLEMVPLLNRTELQFVHACRTG